jgi:hypothetical protein
LAVARALHIATLMRHEWIAVALTACAGANPLAALTPSSSADRGFGTEHPMLVEDASYQWSWVVAREARADTTGDGRIDVSVDLDGETYGDVTALYLMLAPGIDMRIDEYLGRSATGRRLAFISGGQRIVLDRGAGDRQVADLSDDDTAPPEKVEWVSGCTTDHRFAVLRSSLGPTLVGTGLFHASSDPAFGPLHWVSSSTVGDRELCPQPNPPEADWCTDGQQPNSWCKAYESERFDVRMFGFPPDQYLDISHGDIDGTSANDAWRIDWEGVEHWDGHRWSEAEDLPNRDIYVTPHLSVLARDDAWIASGDSLYHWNGVTWSPIPTPIPQYVVITALSAAHDGTVWLALSDGSLLDWDGHAWTQHRDLREPILAFWNQRFAIGDGGLLLHRDGDTWRTLKRLVPLAQRYMEYPLTISGLADHDLWIGTSLGRLLHWNGTTIDTVSQAPYWELTQILALDADTHDVWLNAEGTVLRYRPPNRP